MGQLSARYVLSALGFAQVCLGNEKFQVNTPLFRKARIALSPEYHTCKVAEELLITCDEDPLQYPYIKKMYLNGRELNRLYLTFSEITAGGKLEFVLSKEPCLNDAV